MSALDLAERKYRMLLERLGALDGVVVAFSGGVDSSLLLCAAVEALGERALAVTARSEATPPGEADRAEAVATKVGVRHLTIQTGEVQDPTYQQNPTDRCYHCKGYLFNNMLALAEEHGLEAVVEGSNMDDLGDHRPGRKALGELGIRSPLMEAGLGKAEIRALARARDLPVWDAPSAACLASRVPYGDPITPAKLLRIGAAEAFLQELGFGQLRVRDHGAVARVEVEAGALERFADGQLREAVVKKLTGLGYTYVALDLAGYRTGAMNEILADTE